MIKKIKGIIFIIAGLFIFAIFLASCAGSGYHHGRHYLQDTKIERPHN